jgi:hypothetical protein
MENKEESKKLTEILNDDVNKMLESIAQEVRPLYKGEVAIHEANNSRNTLYISEKGTVTKKLWIYNLKKRYENVIVTVEKLFSDNPNHENKIKVSNFEGEEEVAKLTTNIITKYLKSFRAEHPDVVFKRENYIDFVEKYKK